jgi:hypothetical protein
MAKKNDRVNAEDLFDNLLEEALSISLSQTATSIGIVEFAEDIIFNGESQLYPPQRAILKAFYGEPLDEDELMTLYDWRDNHEITRTTWVDGREYSNLVLEAGRGSGKSVMIAILALYEFYNLITLEDPAVFYNKMPGSPIDIFAIAQSLDQVKQTLFKAIKGFIEKSKYFTSLVKNKTIELYAEEVKCPKKNISLYAKHSRPESLVGYTIKCLILDEVSRFDNDEEGQSKADVLWDNIGRSVVGRFGKHGKRIAISSAWQPGDAIEKLYNLAERSVDTLGFRLKTWQVNLDPTNSEEVLKNSADYIKDPIKAATEYEGIRSLREGTFFIKDNVTNSFKGSSVCDAYQTPLDITNEFLETRHYVGLKINRIDSCKDKPSFAHCDYGVKKDAAALAVCSPIQIEDRWGISVDILLAWKPYLDRDKNNKAIQRVVSFTNCEEVFLSIAKHRKIQKFSFDSYNSEATKQRLHINGISTCEMSTSNPMQLTYFNTTKQLMNQGLLLLPKDSRWSTTAELELQNVFQLPNGKIDHPKEHGKDLADAICNAVYNCYIFMVQSGKITNSSGLVSSINKVSSYRNPNPSSIYKVKDRSWALKRVRSKSA